MESLDAIDADTDGLCPIHRAAMAGNLDTIMKLLARKASIDTATTDGSTALHIAAQHGQVDAVKFLVDQGSDVHSVDEWGNTALHVACQDGCIAVVDALISLNANVNAENAVGKTPLFLAVDECHPQIIRLLIQHGASVNHRDHDGNCPLHSCLECLSDADGLQIATILIENGADINITNKQNKSPLNVAKSVQFSFELCSRISKLKTCKKNAQTKSTQTNESTSEEHDSDIMNRVIDLEDKMTTFDSTISAMQNDISSLKQGAADGSSERERMKRDITEVREQLHGANAKVASVVEELALKYRSGQEQVANMDAIVWSRIFRLISKGAAKEWPNIFRELVEGILPDVINVENQIDEIRYRHPNSMQEQVYNSLVQARKMCGENFTPALLVQALRSCDLNLLADQIENLPLT